VNIAYPGGGDSAKEKCPSSSVYAGASFIVRKEIFWATPEMTTIELEVAVPSWGERITTSGPEMIRRASKSPYPTIARIITRSISRFITLL
jgi:hypothetical protein